MSTLSRTQSCNRTTIAELRNRFVLDNNIPNANRYQEHIVVWAYEAEKQIGSGQFFIPGQEEEHTVNSMSFRVPDYVYRLEDVCLDGGSGMYSGHRKYGSFSRGCSCSCSTCCCPRWYMSGKYIKFNKYISKVKITYTGVLLDDDGFPTISEDHIDAISSYLP